MTKEEFKIRWESNENGGDICFEDIYNAAKEWGLNPHPLALEINKFYYAHPIELKIIFDLLSVIDAENKDMFIPNPTGYEMDCSILLQNFYPKEELEKLLDILKTWDLKQVIKAD